MLNQIRLNKSYLYQGNVVTVLRKQKNTWMPDTLVVRHTDGSIQEVFAKSFRNHATA